MDIPSSFQLLGHTIRVESADTLYQNDDCYGRAYYDRRLIEIQSTSEDVVISDTDREQTFYHELVHFVLYEMGEEKLNQNEKFVNLFGSLLHQAMVSKVCNEK